MRIEDRTSRAYIWGHQPAEHQVKGGASGECRKQKLRSGGEGKNDGTFREGKGGKITKGRNTVWRGSDNTLTWLPKIPDLARRKIPPVGRGFMETTAGESCKMPTLAAA